MTASVATTNILVEELGPRNVSSYRGDDLSGRVQYLGAIAIHEQENEGFTVLRHWSTSDDARCGHVDPPTIPAIDKVFALTPPSPLGTSYMYTGFV